MTDRSHAPDHVFRAELESFEDTPAWDDWPAGSPPETPVIEASNLRVVMVDGDELPEPIEVRSMNIRVRGVDRLASILEGAVAAGRHHAGALADSIRSAVEFERAMEQTMARLGVTREEINAWADQLGASPAEAAAHLDHMANAYAIGPSQVVGPDGRVRVVEDEIVPDGQVWIGPVYDEATDMPPLPEFLTMFDEATPEERLERVRRAHEVRALDGGTSFYESQVTLPDGRVVRWSDGLYDGDAWDLSWEGERLPVGCIADTEDSLEGGDYIACGRPTGDDEDWCPEHKAAIRARTQGDDDA